MIGELFFINYFQNIMDAIHFDDKKEQKELVDEFKLKIKVKEPCIFSDKQMWDFMEHLYHNHFDDILFNAIPNIN